MTSQLSIRQASSPLCQLLLQLTPEAGQTSVDDRDPRSILDQVSVDDIGADAMQGASLIDSSPLILRIADNVVTDPGKHYRSVQLHAKPRRPGLGNIFTATFARALLGPSVEGQPTPAEHRFQSRDVCRDDVAGAGSVRARG